ncbi:hypothetical protein SAMN07250955_11142 [Arboricoccus pini]|uniref:Uncharacterized protein n=1 Tax=Arboricoccus pini TaxID=1963835 RepID=A0A212RN58_9PROT|nr:hypothetical protein [Arboricoccus pini]SNB73961.1 hypothetical protein SAMN07250955_11142 [Arboricoccus pini]
MARFTVKDRQIVRQLGAALAAAIVDPKARAAFRSDPIEALTAAGLDAESLGGRRVVVHEDDATTLNIMMPAEIDQTRLADPHYLEELGRSMLGACKMPLPQVDSATSLKLASKTDDPATVRTEATRRASTARRARA